MISIEARPGNFQSYHLVEPGVVMDGDWSKEAHARFQSEVFPEALGGDYSKLEQIATEFLVRRLEKAAKELLVASRGKIEFKVGELVRHQLYIVPREQRELVTKIVDRFGYSCGKKNAGFFHGDYQTAVVFSWGNVLNDDMTLAHERHHSVGSIMTVTGNSSSEKLMSRTGHKITGKNGARGRLLEEASAVEAGIAFMASELFEKTFPQRVEKMMRSGFLFGPKYDNAGKAAVGLSETYYGSEGEYWLFYRVRQKMIEGARLVDPQFENLLMLSRIHPPLERLVRDVCDKAFGRGTYRWIRRTNHAKTDEEKLVVKQLLNWLDLPKGLVKWGKFERKKKKETVEDLRAILERFSFPVSREAREKMVMVWDRMLLTDKYMGELEATKIVLSSGLAYLEKRGDVVGLTKCFYNRVSSRKF